MRYVTLYVVYYNYWDVYFCLKLFIMKSTILVFDNVSEIKSLFSKIDTLGIDKSLMKRKKQSTMKLINENR